MAASRASADESNRVYRLGVLALNPRSVESVRTYVVPELAKRDFVEGRNLVIETRVGEAEQMARFAADLVALRPDAILAINSTAVAAAQAATPSIPIIMFGGDPIAQGFAASMARPGANITGITIASKDLDVKRLDLLRETIPGVRQIAVLVHPTSPGLETRKEEMRLAAISVGLELAFVEGATPESYGSTLQAAYDAGARALAINADSRFYRDARVLTKLALDLGLPTVCEWGEMAEEGCLIGYGPILPDLYRRTAHFVEQMFKGAAPDQTPIESPARFRLMVNLRTGGALGVTVPVALLLQADGVVE
jgi:putative ABC transport system substrate-binding protein